MINLDDEIMAVSYQEIVFIVDLIKQKQGLNVQINGGPDRAVLTHCGNKVTFTPVSSYHRPWQHDALDDTFHCHIERTSDNLRFSNRLDFSHQVMTYHDLMEYLNDHLVN
jgi:hypothetical protein